MRLGSPAAASALDRRSAGIAEPQQSSPPCRRLRRRHRRWWCRAGGSARRPRPAAAGNARPRPAAADRERRGRAARRGRERMAFEMIDGDEAACRAPAAIALAVISPTITPPISPGPAGRGDARRDRRSRRLASASASADQGVEMVDMRAGGDLRHHPAIGRDAPRAGDSTSLGDHAPVVGDHRRRGLVAARLDAQQDHGSGDRGFAPPRSNRSRTALGTL